MLYEISQLTKVYGTRTVLDIPFLEIEKSRIYALLGPNGAGKTTLLNILAFLDPPTSGTIYYRSRPVQQPGTNLQVLRKSVVMVDQHPILFTTTVYRNLEFGLKIRGWTTKERDRIIAESLDLVGMRDFAGAPAHRLSGGETQRVALARALALSPDVFLCDEPTSGVDVENRHIVVKILQTINEEKKISVVFTTHDRSQANALAQDILVLDRGRLIPAAYENIFSGTIEQANLSGYRFVLQNGMVFDVPVSQAKGRSGSARAFLDPAGIEIAKMEEIVDRPNALGGRIVSITAENEKIRLAVDSGVSINILLSVDDYRSMKFMVGDYVKAVAAPGSVHIL
jgi:tungstate transport system ATP-binding protein